MSNSFGESHVEEAALAYLAALGYVTLNGQSIAPDSTAPERQSYGDVVLLGRLQKAVDRLNPSIPASAREDALRKFTQSETPSLIEENRRLHRYLVEGIGVEFHGDDGVIRSD